MKIVLVQNEYIENFAGFFGCDFPIVFNYAQRHYWENRKMRRTKRYRIRYDSLRERNVSPNRPSLPPPHEKMFTGQDTEKKTLSLSKQHTPIASLRI